MDKEKVIDVFLSKGLDYLKSAESFAQKQVPAYIEEILKFRVYVEAVDCLWALLFIVVGIVVIYSTCFKKWGKEKKAPIHNEECIFPMFLFFGGFPVLAGSLSLISGLLDIIQIHVAPRMYLIEYFTDL